MSGYFNVDNDEPQKKTDGYLTNQNWQYGGALLILAAAFATVGMSIKDNQASADAKQTDSPAAAASAEQDENVKKVPEATR